MPPLNPVRARRDDELVPGAQSRMIASLRDALQRQAGGLHVDLIETHISFVLLANGFAYKLKKALTLGFLDFSTLALRRHFCEEELRLNRRLAPALYLAVVPITGSIGAPKIDRPGAVLDYAVKMRAFATTDLWDAALARGDIGPSHIDELAEQMSAFHREAAVADPHGVFGRAPQIRATVLDSLAALDGLLQGSTLGECLPDLRAWEAASYPKLQSLFEKRLRDGRVRECHGDLHLGNVALVDGKTTVFDCIEFNEAFRWIDVVHEVAFMGMDLSAHGHADLASRFLNACLERSGDYAGVSVLRYYLFNRALVRAKVAALRADQTVAAKPSGQAPAVQAPPVPDNLQRYLIAAGDLTRPARPSLMVTHGFSGSGKTMHTQSLLERVGAVRIRADVERKRMAGLGPLTRSGSSLDAGLYAPGVTQATYARLCALAEPVLSGGFPVILDAAFLQRWQRDQARALAARLGVPFTLLDFEVDLETLRRRVRERFAFAGDVSEANPAVLEAQLARAEPLAPDEQSTRVRCPPVSQSRGA